MNRSSWKAAALAGIALVGCGGGSGGSQNVAIQNLGLTVLASGLNQPMQYKVSPSQPTLAYVIERGGMVRVLVNDVLQTTPVLDISGSVSTSGEGGLLGMTFDPNFATNHYFYLHYSVGSDLDSQVTRFTMDSNGLTAGAGSSHSVIQISQAPYSNHKGGSINFGSDGFLYLGLGDGGSGNDPDNRAQDPTLLLGKMLRIDPTGDDFPSDSTNNYSIPSTNPYASTSGVRGEIWDFGVRNPFRWTVDASTGALVIADVGQGAVEEVDYEPANSGGRNYGWRQREGNTNTGLGGSVFSAPIKEPFFVIDHPTSESIIGGYIYRGSAISGLSGRYLIADYITNHLWSVPVNLSGGEAQTIGSASVVDHVLSSGLSGPVSIDPDVDGEPVIVELNTGKVSRVVPATL